VSASALRLRVVHEESCPEIGPICDERDEPPQLHDQTADVAELRLRFAYGLRDGLAAALEIPGRVVRTDITYRRPDGTAFTPDWVDIHHRDETLWGLGDVWLYGRGNASIGPLEAALQLGVTLPTGAVESDPNEAAAEGAAHQHTQFGVGVLAPLAGARLGLPVASWRVDAHGLGVVALYANAYGYRPGARLLGGLEGAGPLWAGLAATLGVTMLWEGAESWSGMTESELNAGRTELLAGIALAHPVGPARLRVGAKVPLWRRLTDESLRAYEGGTLVELGVEARP
jgi:hypothetical protein